jgi:hypothetical protein
MLDLIYYIATHFTTYKLGWFAQNYAGMFVQDNGWQTFEIITIVLCGIFIFFNICYFLADYHDDQENTTKIRIYFPISLLYIILNAVKLLLLTCFFLSIGGPIGYIIGMSIYVIATIIAFFVIKSNNDTYYGTFEVMGWFIQYAEKASIQIDNKQNYKKKYKEFLNIKY